MKRLLILAVASAASMMSVASTSNAQTIACASEVPSARKGHWYYRIIDGRKCWYEGKALLPKSDLYWPKEDLAAAEADAPEAPAPVATDGRNAVVAPAAEPVAPAAASVSPVASSIAPAAAWPSPALEGISFEQRWLGLRLKH